MKATAVPIDTDSCVQTPKPWIPHSILLLCNYNNHSHSSTPDKQEKTPSQNPVRVYHPFL
jgi:hypothetical protein